MPASPSEDSPGLTSRRSLWAWPVLGLVFTLCGIRLAGLVMDCAVNVPHSDAWDFLTPLFLDEGPWACFLQQHGPPRQGLGGALQWAAYELSGWDVRWESWLCALVLAATAALLVSLSARLRGRLSPVDAVFPLVVMSPIHWETMLLAINIAHSILPLGLISLLAWTRVRPPSTTRALLSGALGVLCLFTGFGMCAAAAFGGLCLLQSIRPASADDRRDALLTGTILVIGLGLFLIGYTWSPAVPNWSFPVSDWWNYAAFAFYMPSSVLGLREVSASALIVGGGLMLGAGLAFVGSFWGTQDERGAARSAIIRLFIGTAAAYMFITAVGRLPAGIEAAFMWRYTTLSSCVVLGLFFWLLHPRPQLSKTPRLALLGAAAALAVLTWGGLKADKNAAVTAAAKRRWIQAYRNTEDIAAANEQARFWIYPPEIDQTRFAARLNWLEKSRLSLFADSQEPPGNVSASRSNSN